jgi:hypothetical protein
VVSPGPPPITLARTGAIAAIAVTGAAAATSRVTGTAALATGRDCTNTSAGTAVIAPRWSRFRYTTPGASGLL